MNLPCIIIFMHPRSLENGAYFCGGRQVKNKRAKTLQRIKSRQKIYSRGNLNGRGVVDNMRALVRYSRTEAAFHRPS